MPTYTSKTLIKGQTPIGQNADGSYIYEQNMSVAPVTPKNITPIELPEALPTVKIGGVSTGIPQIDPERIKKINAPVRDVAGLNKRINPEDQRVKELRQHFDYLKQNNELQLNQEQTDYTRRFKAKYPDYENVPDVILYGKVMLADPKVQEKYGNIGEKTFLQRAGKFLASPIDIVEAGIEGVQAYKDYNPQGALETGVAITSGVGKFVGDTFTNVGANLINLGVPREKNLRGTTSTSELLGKNVGETLKGAGDIVASGIDWMAGEGWTEDTIQKVTEKVQNDPEAKRQFEAAMNILNLLPGGFASKTKKALTAKATIKNIRDQILKKSMTDVVRRGEKFVANKTLFGTTRGATEAFEAGMNKGLKEGLSTGATTLNEWMKTLPDETQKIAKTVEKNVVKNKTVLEGIRNTQTGEKILSKADSQGFDPIDDIARYEELQPVIDSDGRIDTTQAIDNLNAFVEPKAKTVRELIVAENKRISLDEFASNIKKEIAGNKSDIVNNPRWRNVIDDAIETARRDFGDANGTIPLEVVDDIKKSMYDASNFLNPDDTAIKAIARGAKKTIEDNVLSANIKALNQELSRWYSTRSYLKSIGVGKVIKGGRMGKYFAKLAGQGAGAVAGGMVGGPAGAFVGGAVGGEVADLVQGKILSGAIKGTGKYMPESQLFGEAKKTLGESPKQLMPGTEGLPTSYSSRYSKVGEQLGQQEFPGQNNNPNIPNVNKTPAQRLAQAIEKGTTLDKQGNPIKFTPEEIMKHIEKLTDEELVELAQSSPKARQYVEMKSMIDYTNTNIEKYGVLPPSEIKDMVEYIQKGKFTPEQEAYMLKNMPKEIKTEVQRQNRIKDFGEDFTEKKAVTPEEKKKEARKITSKGKLIFMERFGDEGPELYKIAKYAVDNEVEDIMQFNPKPKLKSNTKRGLKNYQDAMQKWELTKNEGHPFVQTLEDFGGGDKTADEVLDEIKDLYNGIDQGKVKTMSAVDDSIEAYEAEMARKADYEAELKSLQEVADTMNEKIDSVTPEPIKGEDKPIETPMQEFEREVKELFDDVRKQDKLDALKKEFDDLASIGEKERKKYAGKGISGQYDASGVDFMTADQISRMTELGGEIRKLEDELRGISSKDDLKKLLSLKKELRKKGIEFKNDESLKSLQEKLNTETPKTPQVEGKTRDFGKYKNTEPGVHLNPVVQRLKEKELSMKMGSGQSFYMSDIKSNLQHALKQGGHKVNLKPEDIHGVYTLDEFIDHPKLFEKYKGLKNQEIVLADFHTNAKRGVVSDGKIYLNSKIFAKDKNDAYSTLVHEIEHRLQEIRGENKYGGDFGNITNKAEMEELAINIQNEFRKSVGLDERSKISFDNPAPKPSLPLSSKSEVKYSKPTDIVSEAKSRKFDSGDDIVDYINKAQDKYPEKVIELYKVRESLLKKQYKDLKPENKTVEFESTCVDCAGGADFVEKQMDKAIEIPKRGEWAKKVREHFEGQGGYRNGKAGNRIDDYDVTVYLNDEYVIVEESGIENFFKID